MRGGQNTSDRRISRTRALIFEAFAELVQRTRFDELRTFEIIEKAGVGKSTFYEHFADKYQVLSESLVGPMEQLASCIISERSELRDASIIEHFWERRALARIVLQPPARQHVLACLTNQILIKINEVGESIDEVSNGRAIFLANGTLGLLDQWLVGKLELSREDLLDLIVHETASKDSTDI